MTKKPKLLVIDDQDRFVELCHALLRNYDYVTRCDLSGPCWTCPERPGCTLTHAHNAKEASDALGKERAVDAVLLDVSFDIPESDLIIGKDEAVAHAKRHQGIAILKKIRNARGDLPVILLTERGELELEESDAALLADEFVTLAGADAFDARAVALLIERSLRQGHTLPEAGGYSFGSTKAMRELGRSAMALSRTSLPILITGEPGTGKSALSEHVIHPESGRGGEHVAVDLSALPPQLVAAELFGPAVGAFSGAVRRDGLFHRAHLGTLLLDEIGNLTKEMQRLLLLVLQNRKVTRLGETTPTPVDVKVVAATNSHLSEQVSEGTFRADLYARLNPAARIHLPPLRERLDDLPELMLGFVRSTFSHGPDRALLLAYQTAAGIDGVPRADFVIGPEPEAPERGVTFVMSRHVYSLLRKHAWPGNLRELSLLISTAALLSLSDATSLSEEGRAEGDAPWAIPLSARLVRKLLESSWTTVSPRTAAGEEDRFVPQLERHGTLRQAAKDLEAQLYRYWFRRTGGDFAAMAEGLLLGPGGDHARKVRLRFNQLGLRARDLREEN